MRSFLTAIGVGVVIALAVPAGTAFAHDPIIFTDTQTTPEAGPLLLDGTVSFALYGTLMKPGDTRGVRVRMKTGDTLIMSLLVPALEPEKSLDAASLPTLSIAAPDGSTRTVPPGDSVTFDEPFTSTSYVRYIQLSEPAQAGDYGVTVSGAVPARFTLSVGTTEQFGTPVENVPNRDLGVAGVMTWYSTPPPTAPATTVPAPTVPASTDAPTTAPSSSDAPTSAPVTATSAPTTGSSSSSDGGAPVGLVVLVVAVLAVSLGAVVAISRRRAPTPR